MLTRSDILQTLNDSNLAGQLGQVKAALLSRALALLQPLQNQTQEDKPNDPQTHRNGLYQMLSAVGPAASQSAVMQIMAANNNGHPIKGLTRQYGPTNDYVEIVHNIVRNEPEEGFQNFTNVMRQFLLPRYAYLDFDQVVDPRHQIDFECGYPKFITPIMYRYMYDRDDMAQRVVDIYPDECWAADPQVYDDEDEEVTTPFEKAWAGLVCKKNILQFLYRADCLAGIGHYGILLLGLDDGKDLEAPVEGILADGSRDPNFKGSYQLLYVRPFDEYLSFIHQYEVDVMHPRYGLPKFYNLVFLDMTIDAAGASIGTRLNRRVHWTRVLHIGDNLRSSLVFGVPRQQGVFNRLLDLRKLQGGSAEMFWKGAFPGISFEIDPRFVADEVEVDQASLDRQIDEYSSGLRRYLALLGVKANSLAPQIADPEKHIMTKVRAIAANKGVPLRIFLGSEEGRLASSQDKLTWNIRLGKRLKRFVEPNLIRLAIDRFITYGILPMPKDDTYFVGWDDLNKPADEDKANLALKWTQAMAQYVSAGIIHLMSPMIYLTQILGLPPATAKKVLADVNIQKLLKVDPSQPPAGQQGNNVPGGQRSGTSGSRPTKRNSATKKAEGTAS